MSPSTQSILYFAAALLFVIAASLNISNEGAGIKSIAGLVTAAVLVVLGLRARRAAGGSGPA
jgi:hypothetical protein